MLYSLLTRTAWLLLWLVVVQLPAFAQQHNYAELLQKSIYFYDAQRSGTMPAYGYAPGQNRVRWMADQHTYDGYDLVIPSGGYINGHGQTITDANKIGALQGGFRDAGDHPKWSQSITFAVNGLAWSGIEYRNAMLSSGQMPYLLANVKWGTDYLLRCFLATNPDDPATYKIVLMVSDYRGEQTVATSSELQVHRNPQRPHFYADKDAPMTPTVANVASSLALASVLFRQNGDAAYADKLVAAAQRLHNFTKTYWGYSHYKRANGTVVRKTSALADSYFASVAPGFSANNLPKTITLANAKQAAGADFLADPTWTSSRIFQHSPQSPNGDPGNYDYESSRSIAGLIRNFSDNLCYTAIWLHKAEAERNGNTALATDYLNEAKQYGDVMATDLSSTGSYWHPTRTDGSGATGGAALPFGFHQVFDYRIPVALWLTRLVPTEPKYRQWLEQSLDNQVNAERTPGGMSLLAGDKNWGPIEQLSPAMFIHFAYGDEVKDPVKKNRYIGYALSQVQYFLGANPENRCYVIGYRPPGVISTNIGLHANALSGVNGFDDYTSGRFGHPTGQPNNTCSGVTDPRNGAGENRNMLYGGVIGGPSTGRGADAPADRYANTDGSPITTVSTRAPRSEVATFYQPYWTGAMARMKQALGGSGGEVLPADFAKEALPDGEDIPHPVPSNSKWMREEFFSEARVDAAPTATTTTVRVRVNNRSRWPQRIIAGASFRYYFTLEPGVNVTKIDLLNPYSNITGTCPADADGATLNPNTEGMITKDAPSQGGTGSDIVVVSTDGAGNRLCYVEVYFRKPSLTTYNYLFDNPLNTSVTNEPFAWRVTKNPLAAAQAMLNGPLYNPTPGTTIPAEGRTDFEVIAPWGVYRSKNIGFAGTYTMRQAVLRLTYSGTNNTANDFSYANLPGTSATPSCAMNIPMYNEGQLLSGDEPTAPGQMPGAPPTLATPAHDYKKAVQRALYYFETQRSGQVAAGITLPNGTTLPNRVGWRGNAHHVASSQGGDIFPSINLVGGLYNAGDDYLKSSHTMAAAASVLAWSAVEFPQAYNQGQKTHLLGTLKYISDYFLQSLTFGDAADVNTYKIYLMVTDRKAATTLPNNYLARHQKWAAAEVMHEFPGNDPEKPVRRYFYADKDAPSVSTVSAMAAALAAGSKVFRDNGDAAYADQLLTAARRMYNFVFHFTHGGGKLLNYTGQNFSTRTIGSLAGYTTNGFNLNGVMKDESGTLVRHDPYLYPASTTIFTQVGARPAGITGANGILATGSSPSVSRMNFNGTQPVGTGADYDAPVPDYHEMPDNYLTDVSLVSRNLHDDLCWAALWLHQAETDPTAAAGRLNEAITYYAVFRNDIAARGNDQGNSFGFHWYRVPSAILLHKLNAPLPANISEAYRSRIEMYTGADAVSPAASSLLANAAANGGFINTTNNRMQRPGGSSAPNMFASLSLFAYAHAMSSENPAPTGARQALQSKFIEVATTNMNAMLGTNANRRSYMIGYDSGTIPGLVGVSGLQNNHHRTALGYFAGIGHRTTGTNSLYRTTARHTQYGGIVSGPQATYNGNYSRETVLSTPSTSWAFESNETSPVTNAFALFGLGYLTRDGSGTVSADFPTPAEKDDEVFVEAGIVSQSASSVRIRATLNNRSLWPARAYDNLRFRYYFTLEDGASVTGQQIMAHDATNAPTISAPVQVSGNQYYVEVAFTDKIYPGGEDLVSGRPTTFTPAGTLPNNPMHYRRTVEFQLNVNSAFASADDWSFAGLRTVPSLIKTKQIPVYDGGTKLFGNEPGSFDLELWADTDNNGTIGGSDVRLNGGNTLDFGTTVLNSPVTRQLIARNMTLTAITINPAWLLPYGISRNGTSALTVPASNGTVTLQLQLDADRPGGFGGNATFTSNAANPLENPFRFSVTGTVNCPTELNVSLTAEPAQVYFGQSATLTAAMSGGQAPYTFEWNTGATGATLTTAALTQTRSFTVTGYDAVGCSSSAEVNVTVVPPGITFEPIADRTYGDAPVSLSATATSGLPVSFSVVSGPATIAGNTLTITGAGEVVVEANQAGDSYYPPATPATRQFTVAKAGQTITFTQLADVVYQSSPLLTFALTATATSGLPISYQVVSGPATVLSDLLTITGIGPVTLQASQVGNQNYLAAADVTQTFAVTTAEKDKGVKPVLECVVNNGNGQWTARFGYKNDMDMPVYIPVGTTNYMTPATAIGQPVSFQPGRIQNVFTVSFPANGQVSWSLAGPDGKLRTATATNKSEGCSSGTRVAAGTQPSVEGRTLGMQVSPNPTSDVLHVTVRGFGNAQSVTLKLNDPTGRVQGEWPLTLTNGQGKTTLDIRHMSAGLYILSAESGNERVTERVIRIDN
ncbi:hypothetical protein GCM10023189_22990 [Nibrella saemangeumensis]|uniref:CBM3 domain-containing protein n=1 Tax=Nibrella saemangeumensis TaxID=1084526 RepID=A0ABP8MTS9_9BACT